MDRIATIAKTLEVDDPISKILMKEHYYMFRHGVHAPHWHKESEPNPRAIVEQRLKNSLANVPLKEQEVYVASNSNMVIARC